MSLDASHPPVDAAKAVWRHWAARIDASSASEAIVEHLGSWRPLEGVVTAFLPMHGEIDLRGLFDSPRCSFALPRVDGGTMSMHVVDDRPLERHRLGFLQPPSGCPEVAPDDVHVVLTPGLAFSRDGRRLGRGGGFYDRFLAAVDIAAIRLGVATEQAVVDDLPTESHDERVDWLVTESGIRSTGCDLDEPSLRFVERAQSAGIAPALHRFPKGTKTSRDAADAIGCELGAIAKSIVFTVDDDFVLVLCSGDRRIDEAKLAAACGGAVARTASRPRVLEVTGYVAGGTPAVGHDTPMRVIADPSLARYRTVWSAGGTADTVYPVRLETLIAASGAQWFDVSSGE